MFSVIKLFSDRAHYRREFRGQLADILRPYWKDASFTEEQRKQMYGLSAENFHLVDNLALADLAVLPMTWNHYVHHHRIGDAIRFIGLARGGRKPILVYVYGDHGVTVPFDDVFIVRASGYRSRKSPLQIAQPVFVDDPYRAIGGLGSWHARRKEARPVVGFCGQSQAPWSKVMLDIGRTGWSNLRYHLRLIPEEPETLYPSVLLRSRSLELLGRSPRITCNFIRRGRYRGGISESASRQQSTLEFYQNIAGSDYTLCVRGGGNFSKRFYETLAMGRIPVFVNTDCLLPLDGQVDWRRYCVWVEASDLASLPERVAEHFAGLGEPEFMSLQAECRKLWEQWLTFGGFARHLADTILRLAAGSARL